MEFDFSQNSKVADINKIPQDFRGLYKQDGETYVLDSEHAGVKAAIASITGLNTALKAARAEAKNRQTIDLTPLKEYGDTPETIQSKIKETIEGLQGQIKGVNIDKIKQDLAGEWNNKLSNESNLRKALEGQLYSELVESRAAAAIKAEGGDVELLLPFVKRAVKAHVVDGKYAVNVVDDAGDIRFSGVTGSPMAVKELVAELKANEKFGKLFASTAPAGPGVKPGAGAQKATKTLSTEEMSPMQKIAAGLAKGQARRS